MKYRELLKTTQFVKNFKEQYQHLKIGRNTTYDFHKFDTGEYAISITTEKVVNEWIITDFTKFMNENKLSWFIGVSTEGKIRFFAQ